jgi:DNA-binding SARP family transcriptional activator/ABC-type branched-subunit amino acid transport system substrate-binding protein/streptogramin lyase
VRFLVLGPLEARMEGREVELGAGRQRALLALLLVRAGEALSTERVIDALWAEQPPASATKVVQGYVSQLRRSLPPETIETRGSGYILYSAETDAVEFERLLEQARDQAPREAVATLRSALALWRGRPYADVEYESWARHEIVRLEDLRTAALEELLDARLQLGEAAGLVPELESLVAEHPLRERLRALLMLALYRAGRQVDALESFADARRRLVDELGIEPGPELQDLQRRILAQDPELRPVPRTWPLVRVARRARWLVGVGVLVAAAAVAAGFLIAGGNGGIEPNSLVLLDAGTGKPTAQIGVGSLPSQVSVGAGAVWVLNSDDNTVSEIDLKTRRKVATFSTGSRTVGIAAGASALWLANGGTNGSNTSYGSDEESTMLPATLTKVDPTTRLPLFTKALPAKFVLAFYTRFPGEHTIVVGGGSVWVVAQDYRLVRVNTQTGAIEHRFSFGADSLAFGGGELWLVQQGAQVMRLDPRTDRIDLTFRLAAGPGIDYGFGSAWVADPVQGLVWRISGGTPPLARSIAVASGSSAVAVSAHSVWATSVLADAVTRIDPQTNRADATIPLTAPQDLAAAASGMWVSTGAPPPSSGPLPASSCSPLVYPGPGKPRFVVASDLALGPGTTPIQRGIEELIRERGFRAGTYTIGYQSCDDATVQAGAFDWAKCIANARAYSANLDVIGVVGTFNSGCSFVEVPILNAAQNGPLAMVSPLSTNGQLTIPNAVHAPGVRMDPTGVRSFARVIASDAIQYAGDAELLHELGVKRVAVLDDGSGNAVDADRWFTYSAHRLGMQTVSVAWSVSHPSSSTVLARVRATHADGVFVAAGGLPEGGPPVAALHRGLGPKIPIVVTDWFAGYKFFLHVAGKGIDGVYGSTAGAPDSFLPAAGRRFARRIGSPLSYSSAYGGAAAQLLLDAIAHSNGTRASVVEELFKLRENTFVGKIAVDAYGDPQTAPVTIFRIEAGARNATGSSDFQNAVVDRVIAPPARIVPFSGVPADAR